MPGPLLPSNIPSPAARSRRGPPASSQPPQRYNFHIPSRRRSRFLLLRSQNSSTSASMGRQKTTGISRYETGTGRNSLRPFSSDLHTGTRYPRYHSSSVPPRSLLPDNTRFIPPTMRIFYIFHAFGTNNSSNRSIAYPSLIPAI